MNHNQHHNKQPIFVTFRANNYADVINSNHALTMIDIAPLTIDDMPAFEQYAEYCQSQNSRFNARICAAHINEHRLALDEQESAMTDNNTTL